MMVVAATFVVMTLMTLFSQLYINNQKDKERVLIEDFGYSIQNEFIMASQSFPGYNRTFDLPVKLEGFEYDIEILNQSLLFINASNQYATFRIPKTIGQIIIGQNHIVTRQNNQTALLINQ